MLKYVVKYRRLSMIKMKILKMTQMASNLEKNIWKVLGLKVNKAKPVHFDSKCNGRSESRKLVLIFRVKAELY